MDIKEILNTVVLGDCISVMKELPENSIDCIITDCPYEIGFMGKDFDKTGISFKKETWAACLRVVKPGGTLLCFGGTRTWHRIACAIEDGGWRIFDTLMWLYGSGFPKAGDISKMIDKQRGLRGKVIGKGKGHTGERVDNKECNFDDDNYEWPGEYDITAPISPEAQKWEGWKTHSLKPAWEPVICAMKPNDGTYAENVLKWGVGGLNIDGCRIDYKDEQDKSQATPQGKCTSKEISAIGAEPDAGRNLKRIELKRPEQKGRFPSNLILDEEASKLLDKQSGKRKSGGKVKGTEKSSPTKNDYGVYGRIENEPYMDKGGASRFFYCAKASRSERNFGLENFEKEIGHNRFDKCKTCDGYILQNPDRPSACKCEHPVRENNKVKGNFHPTVKPISLCRYLIRLITPKGGVVLDPFIGSGSTGCAAIEEGFDFIGIEKELEYKQIADARVKACSLKVGKSKPDIKEIFLKDKFELLR